MKKFLFLLKAVGIIAGAVIVIYISSQILIEVPGIIVGLKENIRQRNMSELYKHYQYPSEACFGKQLYSEIDYVCTDYEAEIANALIDKARDVGEYTGTEQDCEAQFGDVGELSYYYYFNIGPHNADAQEVSFQFITCTIYGNQGHIWTANTITRYDVNGELVYGGWSDVLTLWEIEYQDNEWRVIQIRQSL